MSNKPNYMYDPNDIMRRRPLRAPTEHELEAIDLVKEKGERLWEMFNDLGISRNLSLAKTHLEEAVMHAVKHLTE